MCTCVCLDANTDTSGKVTQRSPISFAYWPGLCILMGWNIKVEGRGGRRTARVSMGVTLGLGGEGVCVGGRGLCGDYVIGKVMRENL